MLKFIAYFKKKFNIKGFAEWLNYSIWNRAVFAYTSATLSIFVRYCLYSIHNGCWLPDYVTLYSAVFTYTIVTFFLFVFFILRSVKLGDFMRRFIDIDRIRENRLRAEKFRSLVVETRGAHNSFKIYSYSYLPTFGISFFLITVSSGTGLGAPLSFCVAIYNLWVVLNILYFAWCMHKTIVPEELKTIKPSWLIRWEEFNNRADLMNGVGTAVTESATGSGLGKRVLNKASNVATKSFNYVTDPKNTAVIVRSLFGAGTMIVGLDYSFAEATQRTSYFTQALEVNAEQTYSPDPDTRSKAAALRRRGFDLSDCCEPGTRCLNPELVENKYDITKPYESKRYLALENEKIALENEKIALNEKVAALEQENNKLNYKENSLKKTL